MVAVVVDKESVEVDEGSVVVDKESVVADKGLVVVDKGSVDDNNNYCLQYRVLH